MFKIVKITEKKVFFLGRQFKYNYGIGYEYEVIGYDMRWLYYKEIGSSQTISNPMNIMKKHVADGIIEFLN